MTHPSPKPSPRLTQACGWLCLLVAIGLPIGVVAFWLAANPIDLYGTTFDSDMMRSLPAQPQAWQRAASAAVMLAPAIALSLGLLSARRSLSHFAQGRYFVPEAIDGLKRFAFWGFWAVTGSVIAPSVIGVILTWLNAPGHKELTISLRPDQVLGLLVAGLFWIIAGVLVNANGLADENRQFV
jgi:Protein of unknown function (DUF2975)